MAYIPTIHTFEDDLIENKDVAETKNQLGVEPIVPKENILIPEKKESSVTKKIFILLSVLFFIGAISVIGYFYYIDYKNKQAEANLNAQSLAKQEEQQRREQATVVNNLKVIFPNLADGMGMYISSSVKRDNVIVITIKDNTDNGVNNYSQLYAYLLAHQSDLGTDLVDTFKLNDVPDESLDYQEMIRDSETDTSSTTLDENISSSTKKDTKSEKKASSTNTLASVVNLFDPKSLESNFNNLVTNISKPTAISGDKLVWESKTLNDQDFKITNAGVVTIVYGYVNKNYLVFSLSLKDFFETAKGLK